ncbi:MULTISPECIES: hypothetical protein [Bradyrhizobium]|uniref:Uncharacterized protein n=2 Tax=Bradyrhizobium vignae TaxID=1549949 RepID=A0A2U3PVX2_9BRAD|nr:hypothetical protein [Bradyrhizobium vignae]SPP93317.1 conserved protein of unknown function [Bradyrhizobium vignae]
MINDFAVLDRQSLGAIVMSIRNTLFAAAFGIASLTAAHAEGLRPIEAKSINLGGISGVAYYTVERDGFRVVATLAQGETGTPFRVVSLLTPGQRLLLSTPQPAGVIEISREGDSVLVRKPNTASN